MRVKGYDFLNIQILDTLFGIFYDLDLSEALE